MKKEQIKYLNQIKQTSPTLNARIKVCKKNSSIRPVINVTQAATYTLNRDLLRL